MMKNPYAGALGDRNALEAMTETPLRLAKLLEGLPVEKAGMQPAPGKWSIREVLCHLADCEIVWAWRLRVTFEKDKPTLEPFEQDPWARIYGAYTLPAARAAFTAMRTWNLAFLGALSDADRQRPAYHPERGDIVLWDIVEGIAGHDLHHLVRLEEEVARLRA